MKKIALSIIAGLLAAAMITGLTACSIDIHTGNGADDTYHIDLGEIDLDGIVSGISEKLEDIKMDEIVNGISERIEDIDLEEIGEGLSEQAEAFMGEMADTISEHSEEINGFLGSLFNAFGANAGGTINGNNDFFNEGGIAEIIDDDISDPDDGENAGHFEISLDESLEDITIDDIRNMDVDELLGYLKEILEANGMGAYYEVIKAQIESNPELIQQFLDEYLEEYFAE